MSGASGPLMGIVTAQSRDGDRERNSQVVGLKPATISASGMKRPHDANGDHPADGPVKRRVRTEPGVSEPKVTGTPQYVAEVQEEVVVLPPMPKKLYDELMASPIDMDSATEPESSDDERGGRRKNLD